MKRARAFTARASAARKVKRLPKGAGEKWGKRLEIGFTFVHFYKNKWLTRKHIDIFLHKWYK